MSLAARLGKTVAELEAALTLEELAAWIAFTRIEQEERENR